MLAALGLKNLTQLTKAAAQLQQERKRDPHVMSYIVSKTCTLLFCSSSEHFYAVATNSANTIQSGKSCIRKAYRFDPQSGTPLSQTLKHGLAKQTFSEFAVKEYTGRDDTAEATIEVETFQQHQFAEELLVDANGHPIVISIFFPGVPVTSLDGKTAPSLSKHGFLQQLDLCYQLAEQYFKLHHHPSAPKIHVDVKGQNTIVYPIHDDTGTSYHLKLIDFGSVRKLSHPDEQVTTSLLGVTDYAVAPEVIATAQTANRGSVSISEITGTLSTKSDVFSMAAIMASLFRVDTPYSRRLPARNTFNITRCEDLPQLALALEQPFDFSGLFDSSTGITYRFPDRNGVRFIRCAGSAPDKANVLAQEEKNKPCYVCYDNYLLYVEGSTVFGYDKRLNRPQVITQDYTDNKLLSADALTRLDGIIGYQRRGSGERLQDALQSRIKDFLTQMAAFEPSQRPTSSEVFAFFKTAYQLAVLAETSTDCFSHNPTARLNPQTVLRTLRCGLIKLDLIYLGASDGLTITLPGNDRRVYFPLLSTFVDTPAYDRHYGELAQFTQSFFTQAQPNPEEKQASPVMPTLPTWLEDISESEYSAIISARPVIASSAMSSLRQMIKSWKETAKTADDSDVSFAEKLSQFRQQFFYNKDGDQQAAEIPAPGSANPRQTTIGAA